MFLSIEFGSNIKIVQAYKRKNIIRIEKCVTIDAPVDINKGLYLTGLINETLKKNNIRAKKTFFIINTETVIIRKMKLPFLNKKKEIITMIMHELGQSISADLSRYKITYKIIETFEEDGRKTALYAAYCLPLNIYEFYVKLGKKLKLKLQSINITSNCLNNILQKNIELNNIALSADDVYAFVFSYLSRCKRFFYDCEY
mgnify:CR=1 FL=1